MCHRYRPVMQRPVSRFPIATRWSRAQKERAAAADRHFLARLLRSGDFRCISVPKIKYACFRGGSIWRLGIAACGVARSGACLLHILAGSTTRFTHTQRPCAPPRPENVLATFPPCACCHGSRDFSARSAEPRHRVSRRACAAVCGFDLSETPLDRFDPHVVVIGECRNRPCATHAIRQRNPCARSRQPGHLIGVIGFNQLSK